MTLTPKAFQASSNFKEIFQKAIDVGLAGGSAMAIQVSTLMWMRTTMNYQIKHTGGFFATLKQLYSQGGVSRFYRGIVPALIHGPNSRFGDTAANMLATGIFTSSSQLKDSPIFLQTSLGSVFAGSYRFFSLPLDAWKTSKQVNGKDGLDLLLQKYRSNGISAFYQGGVASALATVVGHYPWFLTNNYLDHYLPRYSYETQFNKAIIRSALIGFTCTLISDTLSNSVRVLKTYKQTSANKMSYKDVIS